MITFRTASVLSGVLALTVNLLPVSAQGISEMGAAYGASAGLTGAASRGAAGHRAAVGGLFGSSANMLNSLHDKNSGHVAQLGIDGKPLKVGPDGEPIVPDSKTIARDAANESNKLFVQAQAKEKAGKLEEAQKLYVQALYVRHRIWGDKDQSVVQMYGILGALSMKRNKPEDAEVFFRHKLTPELKRYGIGSWELVPTLDQLGDSLLAQRKYVDAGNYFQQVQQLRERRLGEENKQTVVAALKLATAYAGAEKEYWPDAELLYKHNIALAEKTPEDASLLPKLYDGYSALLRKQNKVEEADKIANKASELRAPQAPPAVAPPQSNATKKDELPAPAPPDKTVPVKGDAGANPSGSLPGTGEGGGVVTTGSTAKTAQ